MRPLARSAAGPLLGLLALAVLLPLRTDGGQAECCNLTTSTSLVVGLPATGDEQFFNLPSGPANVMVLLDTSGSMNELPQCGSDGSGLCAYPAWNFNAVGFLVGTCNGGGQMNAAPWAISLPDLSNPACTTSTAALSDPNCPRVTQNWLDYFARYKVVFPASYADPGYTTATVTDAPPWSGAGGCTSGASSTTCLFDRTRYFAFGAWTGNASNPTSAIPTAASPCASAWNPAECQSCLDTKGWYMYTPLNRNRKQCDVLPPQQVGANCFNGNATFFKGDWLNANPPKYVAARRVVKQLAKIDATRPSNFDNIRLGLTGFNVAGNSSGFSTGYSGRNDGATLIVPLGPDCPNSFASTPGALALKMKPARQAIIDAINGKSPTGASQTYVTFSNSTPLAEALFHVGQYYSNAGASSFYQSVFGSAWMRTGGGTQSFDESAPGTWGAGWAQGNPNQHSFCWSCQTSSVVIITDGAPNQDVNLPSLPAPPSGAQPLHGQTAVDPLVALGSPADFRYMTNPTVDCPPTLNSTGTAYLNIGCGYDLAYGSTNLACGKNSPWNSVTSSCVPNMLHRVAWFLNGVDLRPDLLDQQNVKVYPISFGLDLSDLSQQAGFNLLQKTADLGQARGPGQGLFANSSSADDLSAALFKAVSDVVSKTTSFAAPASATLQTTQAQANESFMGRFRPTGGPSWEGHLFEAFVFDEFVMGCDPTLGPGDQPKVRCGNGSAFPNFNQDVDGNGKNVCDGVFLVDQDCDEIVEDIKTGVFKKKKNNVDANLFWDAGKVLSDSTQVGYRSASESAANKRNVFTFLNGAKVAFESANAATILPFLALDQNTCLNILKSTGNCGALPLPACPVPGPGWPATALPACARHIIHFVRGWDVTDQDGDGCAGPGNPSNAAKCPGGVDGEQRDRANDGRGASASFWKLGDVFHSAPQVARPPIDEITCKFGFENQCVATLFSPTELPSQTRMKRDYVRAGATVDAYAAYAFDNASRKRIVLAGSNDGLFHAFDGGQADTAQPANPLTGVRPFTPGTGEELWAYVPADLLPRLKDTLFQHQYLADGPAMIRDVWVDANGDGVKTVDEFHTLAILSERGGGSQWTALDVTDPLDPVWKWTFPPPCSEDARWMAQGWTDFAPRPPPIGPVKLKVAAGGGNDPDRRGFEERWIAMINGGYDPALDKGRAVFMVDAWTGQVLWRFTDADARALAPAGGLSPMLPVPGAVGLVDLGDTATQRLDIDGFFDTATWGDVGGNVWVARFFDPGEIGGNGRVGNWFAARTLEERRQGSGVNLSQRSEFYFMTANAYEPASRTLRTFIGGGNREQLLKGGTVSCGQDDVFSCCQAGCTVTSTTLDTFPDGTTASSAFACSAGNFTSTAPTTGAGPAACLAGSYSSRQDLTFNCGSGPLTFTGNLVCDAASATCGTRTSVGTHDIAITNGNGNAGRPKYRFYGIWSYGKDGAKQFRTAAEARAFDANRFTDVPFAGCTGPAGGTCQLVETTFAQATFNPAAVVPVATVTCSMGARCQANTEDAGWFYEYGNACSSKTCTSAPPWTDEKTATGANVVFGCSTWNGFRPSGAGGANPCAGGSGNPVVFQYVSDFVKGTPSLTCGFRDGGTIYMAQARSSIAPPVGPQTRVSLNAQGQVQYSTMQFDPGAPPGKTTLGTRTEIGESVYWLEVPRQLHTCRHVDPATCQ